MKQRRSILIFLISANMIVGKFPSRGFLSRPEAADLLPIFIPIANAIRKGNFMEYQNAIGEKGGYDSWLRKRGVLLLLRSRCKVLLWRTLARRVFFLTYQFPADPNSRRAATLDLNDLTAAALYCQRIMEGWTRPIDNMTAMQSGRQHTNIIFMKKPDLVPPKKGKRIKPRPSQGMIHADIQPTRKLVEAKVASLVQQELLHGFISHNQGKFAITGAKQRGGPLSAGFPPVY